MFVHMYIHVDAWFTNCFPLFNVWLSLHVFIAVDNLYLSFVGRVRVSIQHLLPFEVPCLVPLSILYVSFLYASVSKPSYLHEVQGTGDTNQS